MKRSQDIYSKKQRWKLILFLLASTIILGSIYLSNAMVAKIANKEQAKAKQWAQTIQKKVALLNITKKTFESLENREKQRIQLVVDAIKTIMNPSELSMNQDLDFAMKIRDGNKDIPMVILDDRNLISSFSNIHFKTDSLELTANHKKRDSLLQEKAQQWKKEQRFFTIEVFEGVNFMLTYDQSQSLKSLRFQSDSILQAFNKDLIKDTRLMPVVLMDQNKKRIIASNIEGGKDWDGKQLKAF
jgi:two-component system, sporulation sensor kinase D